MLNREPCDSPGKYLFLRLHKSNGIDYIAMKKYESPLCDVDWLEMESSFLTGASTEGYPVTPDSPFKSHVYDLVEGGYEE